MVVVCGSRVMKKRVCVKKVCSGSGGVRSIK